MLNKETWRSIFKEKEIPDHYLGSGHLILAGIRFWGGPRRVFSDHEDFFHASLSIFFNKCHKKAVFMKIFEFRYIKYQLDGR